MNSQRIQFSFIRNASHHKLKTEAICLIQLETSKRKSHFPRINLDRQRRFSSVHYQQPYETDSTNEPGESQVVSSLSVDRQASMAIDKAF